MMKLLIVEDDPDQRRAFESSINSLTNLDINYEFAENFSGALEKFQTFDPDCIFLDIQLSDGPKGNDLFDFISKYSSSKIIRIITGLPGSIEAHIRDLTNKHLFKIYVRTDKSFAEIIQEVYSIFISPSYSLITGKELPEKIRDIYYKQIDPLIGDVNVTDGLTKHRILRYLGTNLYEHFYATGDGLDKVYPWEMFFYPPILKFFYTGDIIKSKTEDKYFIILNPTCDLVPREGICDVEECIFADLEAFKPSDYDNGQRKFSGKGKDYISNRLQSYHFIPQIGGIGPFNINFRKIQHDTISSMRQKYDRIASITPAFMKGITQRFSHYYSRQGQPDFDIAHLETKYLEN